MAGWGKAIGQGAGLRGSRIVTHVPALFRLEMEKYTD